VITPIPDAQGPQGGRINLFQITGIMNRLTCIMSWLSKIRF
jgi:hypothetical protein